MFVDILAAAAFGFGIWGFVVVGPDSEAVGYVSLVIEGVRRRGLEGEWRRRGAGGRGDREFEILHAFVRSPFVLDGSDYRNRSLGLGGFGRGVEFGNELNLVVLGMFFFIIFGGFDNGFRF